jgi:hypothetical protein
MSAAMRTANQQSRTPPFEVEGRSSIVANRLRIALAFAGALLFAVSSSAVEPTVQPADALLKDPNSTDSIAELRISWSAGNGDGTIVVLRQGGPVDADPVDGNNYTASATFGSGAEIGTGNFVVYLGPLTEVTVSNLQEDVPYFAALYSKNGTGAAIDYLQLSPSRKAAGHNGSHAIECASCHFDPSGGAFHGGFAVPRGTVQATVCKTCHSLTGDAAAKSAVDIHVGPNYSTVVDCGSCHDVHNNGNGLISSDSHPGGATSANRQWIRADTQKYVPGAQEPALFQGRCTGNGALSCNSDADCAAAAAGTCDSTRFFAFDDGESPWNGLCQNCHTQTGTSCCGGPRHTNDGVGPADHVHEVPGGVANNCTACHSHEGQQGTEDGFTPQGGACTSCHNAPKPISASPGSFRRQILEGTDSRCSGDGNTICTTDTDCSVVGGTCSNGEFGSDFMSHHVNDGTGNEIATIWDCVVCHAEGDVLTGSPNSAYHQKDGVQLKDVDTGAVYADWSTLTAADRSDFCLSCHDVDGATIVSARTDPDPDATTNPLNPFNDGVTNAHEGDGWIGLLCTDNRTPCSRDRDCNGSDVCDVTIAAPHSRGRCSTTAVIPCNYDGQCPSGETCNSLQVVDVEQQFDLANSSHHAVLGAAYGSAAPFGSNVDNAIQGVRTDLAWNSVIDCEDCHYGSATNKLQAHGTAKARYMLRDKDGNDTLPTPTGTGNLNVLCYRCHISSGDAGNYDSSVSAYTQHTQGAHIDDTRNLFGIACLNCHGGGEFGAVHGIDGLVTDDDGGGSYNPNVFTWGSALDLVDDWTAGGSPTCSTVTDPTLLGDCTQHGSKTDNAWRSGSESRTYRDP